MLSLHIQGLILELQTIPHILGVTLGFTSLVLLTIGLINIFKLFPIIQLIIKYLGTLFLLYLAFKISFSSGSSEIKKENPVKFIETFLFQYLNPKRCISSNNSCFNIRRVRGKLY